MKSFIELLMKKLLYHGMHCIVPFDSQTIQSGLDIKGLYEKI